MRSIEEVEAEIYGYKKPEKIYKPLPNKPRKKKRRLRKGERLPDHIREGIREEKIKEYVEKKKKNFSPLEVWEYRKKTKVI